MPLAKTPLLGMLSAATLAGCNLAPKYVRPLGAMPTTLPAGGVYPAAASDAVDVARLSWRDFFTDDRLRQTIRMGLTNNRDLRVAAANVLQARAQYRIARADLVPSTTLSASATYTNNVLGVAGASAGAADGGANTGAGGNGGNAGDGAAGSVGSAASDYQFYSISAGFTAYELDLFGRIRNLNRAALEQYFATAEAQRSARISLIAEIASAWLTLAADQDQLAVSQRSLASFAQSLELTRSRFRSGYVSDLEPRQSETAYEGARNDIAALKTRVAQDKNALDLLVGSPVPTDLLPQGLGIGNATLQVLPSGLASDVLLRRPDVLQAEHQLIAQTANIGAARAALFPRISLTAALGTISPALSGLFSGGSFTYTGAPSVVLPLFDGGRLRANVEVSRARQQAAVSTYEKAVQTAFREVADALAQRGTIDEQISAQTARAEAATITLRIADARYRAGLQSFLNSLDAQRTAYAAQQQLISTRLDRSANLVELYRSLGGGLDTLRDSPGPQRDTIR